MIILGYVALGIMIYLAVGFGVTYLVSRHEGYVDDDAAILVTLVWPLFGLWALAMYVAHTGAEHGKAAKKEKK